MTHFLPRCGFFVSLLAGMALLAGCAKPPAATVKAPPPDVLFVTPTIREVTDYEDFTGRTESFRVVDIRPEVTGRLRDLYFKDGQFVTEGDLLFQIEDELYVAAAKKAAADLTKAKADILNWEAQIKLAEAELKRAKRAAEGNAVAQTDVDKAEATLASDKAQLQATEAMLEAAKAAKKTADTMLSYTQIHAQFTGKISRRMVDPGNILKANETVLTRLVDLDQIYIAFDIDERSVLTFRKLLSQGKMISARETRVEVLVGLSDEEGYPHRAPIVFSDNQLDLNTGTLRIRAQMDNPSLLSRPFPAVVGMPAATAVKHKINKLLSPGMFVRVRMPIGKPHPGVLIPEEGLGSDQGLRYLYVINDAGEAQYRRVKLGPQEGPLRVIDEGLQAGERVIVSGLQRVRDKMKVNAKPLSSAKK